MRRIAAGSLVASVAALIIAACGGSSPMTPTPPSGGGGGGGGGGAVTNTPPQIKSITVSDTRVEVGTPVTLTAVVEDQETPVANLTYEWSALTGSFTGTGAIVTWTPGADAVTPADFVVTLTVTERYASGAATLENKVTGTVTAHVNNSPKELADMSLRFLGDFANSKVSPDKCVSEFSDSCRGKKDEFADIDDNRHDYDIIASTLRHTSLSIASNRVSATVHTFCSFTSRVITTQPRDEPCQNGKCPLGSIQGPVTGDCFTNDVYQSGRWWLCDSHFGPLNGILTDFARAFFHVDRHELP
jgi:hypothetical protein